MFGYSNNDSAYICIFIVIRSHAEGHKITNVPVDLKVCDVIFCMLAKQLIGHFVGFFEGASTFLTRSKNPPLNNRLFVLPAEKITSRIPNFRICGKLIVNIERMEILGVVHDKLLTLR
jgi:hypothetical protein